VVEGRAGVVLPRFHERCDVLGQFEGLGRGGEPGELVTPVRAPALLQLGFEVDGGYFGEVERAGPVVVRVTEDRQQTGPALPPLATCPPSQGGRRRFVGAPHDGGAVGDGTACGQSCGQGRGQSAGRENIMRGA
jgi:hypothetical protein